MRNVAKKTHKQTIRELLKHNNKPLPRQDYETDWVLTFLMLKCMLLASDLLGHITLANKSLFLSDVDWFAVLEFTECLKPVYDTTTEIQLKKSTAGEFFGEWLKCSPTAAQECKQCFFFRIGYASCYGT